MSDSTTSSKPYKLLSIAELKSQNPPDWLIEGLVEHRSFAVLYGASGGGKSFVALDMALCVATGSDWHGRKVKPATVVYVVAEGTGGMPRRVMAWLQHHEKDDVSDAFFLLDAPQLVEPGYRDRLIQAVKEQVPAGPVLIVFDTFAQCLVGMDENNSKDVGLWIDACRSLRTQIDATVVLVHHTGKRNEAERGSSALRAAAESMIRVSPRGPHVVVDNDKQKDDEEAPPIVLRRLEVTITDYPKTSCVLMAADPSSSSEAKGTALNPVQEALMETLQESSDALLGKELKSATPLTQKTAQRTFNRHLRRLIDRGLVEALGSGTAIRYRLPPSPDMAAA